MVAAAIVLEKMLEMLCHSVLVTRTRASLSAGCCLAPSISDHIRHSFYSACDFTPGLRLQVQNQKRMHRILCVYLLQERMVMHTHAPLCIPSGILHACGVGLHLGLCLSTSQPYRIIFAPP